MDMDESYVWRFNHRNRQVTFGPYPTADEAKEAFQRKYGYWPEAPVSQQLYTPRRASSKGSRGPGT